MKNYIEFTTTENAKVFIRKNGVGAIEFIQGTSRTGSHVKIYVEGFSINIKEDLDEVLRKLDD
jgi:hypothetical protein